VRNLWSVHHLGQVQIGVAEPLVQGAVIYQTACSPINTCARSYEINSNFDPRPFAWGVEE
jgi:hypothetical protein